MLEKESPETPLLDRSNAAVKELIRSAKKRGYVTHDQINALLSSDEVKSEQIEDILAKLSEMGVSLEAEFEEEVATREEPEEEAEGENELVEVQQRSVPAKSGAKEPAERTNDPVRMYLREMSSVELLSRESETVPSAANTMLAAATAGRHKQRSLIEGSPDRARSLPPATCRHTAAQADARRSPNARLRLCDLHERTRSTTRTDSAARPRRAAP